VLIIGEPLKGCAQRFVCKLWAKNRSALLNNVSKRKQKPIRMTEAAPLLSKLVFAQSSGFEEVCFMWYFTLRFQILNVTVERYLHLFRISEVPV
jgi:hypothetical protein